MKEVKKRLNAKLERYLARPHTLSYEVSAYIYIYIYILIKELEKVVVGKEKPLSQASREILIKVMAQSFSTYGMRFLFFIY